LQRFDALHAKRKAMTEAERVAARARTRRRRAERETKIAATQAGVQDPNALLHIASVMSRTSLGRSKLYELIRERAFPQPVRLGLRCVRWRAGDIAAWLAEKAGVQA
jgi:prophage regulatory protein